MKGDYSRASFSPRKRYTSVRMQQGRVQLDADWNEQADITRDAIAAQARDLLGPGAVPAESAGFALTLVTHQRGQSDTPQPDIEIGAGSFYVGGLRCENEQPAWYADQPGAADLFGGEDGRASLLYLDAWERHVTALEDPDLREPALGGPDTATRTQVVWRLAALPLGAGTADWSDAWRAFADAQARRPRMAASAGAGAPGNQLYRVEIHAAGTDGASFKWSRENGAVAFQVLNAERVGDASAPQLRVTCALLERDRLALCAGDPVELEDDASALGAARSLLGRVAEVRLTPGEDDQLGALVGEVRIEAGAEGIGALLARWQPKAFGALHPLLRRWDRNATSAEWAPRQIAPGRQYELENGICVSFDAADGYAAGDYWQFAVRAGAPALRLPARPPDGVVHHLAPIGLLSGGAGQWQIADLRKPFGTLPQLHAAIDDERRRIDTSAIDLARLRADFEALLDEVSYLRRKVKDLRGQLYDDYQADDALAPGDMVAPNPAQPGYIVKTQEANETMAIGVVSEVLALHGAPRYRVVSYGRAPCKVVGPVAAGDMLVVADEDGYARRAGLFIRPGTVLGKALADAVPDESGRFGLVDAMVTLG
ncbi:DUF6519 domain-containing protein [Kouleothrix sp.]|uniref:DUF6519 domain-containing protein n=1 Tax=Kouleothrix sp. TaxID=2779161 RepID=UPI00391BB40F